jgi:hypothetical protein
VTVVDVRGSLGLALAIATAGCFGEPNTTPVGPGSCSSCKAKPDAGSSAHPDAGPADAGGFDAGVPDAGPPDAGTSDAGPEDAGPPVEECPKGSISFPGLVQDLCQSESLGTLVALDGVAVSTLSPYSATVSSDGGYYVACLPPNQPTTLVYRLAGYETSYSAEIDVDAQLATGQTEILTSMVCTAAVKNYFQEIPQFDTSLGTVYIAMVAISPSAPCDDADAGYSGWTFTATLVDGGIGDGGPWPIAYFDSSWTLESVGATFGTGQAMIYNIDPGIEYVAVQGTNPQLASQCPSFNAVLGFTGRGYVAPNSFDYYPWIIP